MTYKKRPGRMCDDDYICDAMDLVSRGGGVLQLHCESGNIIEFLENKLIGEGHTHPVDFPTACPDWAEEEAINRAIKMGAATNCPTLRSPPEHPVGAGADQAGPSPRTANLDRDLSPVPIAFRCGNVPLRGRWPRSVRRCAPKTAPTATPCGTACGRGISPW